MYQKAEKKFNLKFEKMKSKNWFFEKNKPISIYVYIQILDQEKIIFGLDDL